MMSMSRGAVEKKTVLENLDLVLLAMDETVDKGCAAVDPFAWVAFGTGLTHMHGPNDDR